jgi:hypothetical protein
MTSRNATTSCAALALSVAALFTVQAQSREFAHVRELGGALVEYNDGATQAVAAYYHSQRNHDSKWLLIEMGMMSRRALTLGRDQVELVTPAGLTLPLASQRQWRDDSGRARTLLQQALPTRHQVKSYFREVNGREELRFFTRPEEGGTTIDSTQVMPEQVVLGDLYFESPMGLWDRGTYTLVIHRPSGQVKLPIDLR